MTDIDPGFDNSAVAAANLEADQARVMHLQHTESDFLISATAVAERVGDIARPVGEVLAKAGRGVLAVIDGLTDKLDGTEARRQAQQENTRIIDQTVDTMVEPEKFGIPKTRWPHIKAEDLSIKGLRARVHRGASELRAGLGFMVFDETKSTRTDRINQKVKE